MVLGKYIEDDIELPVKGVIGNVHNDVYFLVDRQIWNVILLHNNNVNMVIIRLYGNQGI
jgi:hypothetical protein